MQKELEHCTVCHHAKWKNQRCPIFKLHVLLGYEKPTPPPVKIKRVMPPRIPWLYSVVEPSVGTLFLEVKWYVKNDEEAIRIATALHQRYSARYVRFENFNTHVAQHIITRFSL
jgi:hypothetical protein